MSERHKVREEKVEIEKRGEKEFTGSIMKERVMVMRAMTEERGGRDRTKKTNTSFSISSTRPCLTDHMLARLT